MRTLPRPGLLAFPQALVYLVHTKGQAFLIPDHALALHRTWHRHIPRCSHCTHVVPTDVYELQTLPHTSEAQRVFIADMLTLTVLIQCQTLSAVPSPHSLGLQSEFWDRLWVGGGWRGSEG